MKEALKIDTEVKFYSARMYSLKFYIKIHDWKHID